MVTEPKEGINRKIVRFVTLKGLKHLAYVGKEAAVADQTEVALKRSSIAL